MQSVGFHVECCAEKVPEDVHDWCVGARLRGVQDSTKYGSETRYMSVSIGEEGRKII